MSAPARRNWFKWMAAGVVVALGAGLGAYGWFTRFATDIPGFRPLDGRPLLPALSLELDSVHRIEVAVGPDATALYRDEGGWHVEQRGGYPARPSLVDRVLTGLAGLQAVYVFRGKEPDFNGVSRVTLFGRDGEALAGLATGQRVPTAGEEELLTVRLDGDPRVWLTADEFTVSADPITWVDRAIIDLTPYRITEIVVEAPDGQGLTVSVSLRVGSSRAQDGVFLEEGAVPAGFKPTDLVTAFRGLNFDEVRAADGSGGPPWRMRVKTDQGLGLTYTVEVRPDDGGVWLTLAALPGRGAETPEEARQFNARHEGWAYRLERFALQPLMVPGALDGAAIR